MRLTGGQVERFLEAPDPKVAAVLVYGPDEGLVRERVARLINRLLDDPNDPFRASELAGDLLRSEPGRLADEAQELAFTGERRVVRVRQASDQATPACKTLLALDRIEAFVILDAGDLGPSSSLRKLFEGAKAGAALPCYRDQGRDLATVVDQLLSEHALLPDPDARAYLLAHLGADRALTRSEVERLSLYLAGSDAPRPPARQRLTLEDVARVVGDSAALGLDDYVDAVMQGEVSNAFRVLDRLFAEGQHPVRIVRSLANHADRLHQLALEVEAGGSPQNVVERTRPPIHFRRKERVRRALAAWTSERTARARGRLAQAELGCKSTGAPAVLLCGALTLELCRLAGAGGGAPRPS